MIGATIPKGYKQTKVGVIPEEWEVVKLGDIATFYKGKGISKKDISKYGTPCIRYGELYTKYDEKIQNIFSKTNLDKEKLFLSQANDILIPASGETAIDLATASCVLKNNIGIGGDINVIRSSINGIFLSYYLNIVAKTNIASLAQGVSVIHLYSSQLKSLYIVKPPLKEQQKIANILTTWDKAIEKMQKLITAKEKLKKGLMQKLLSGEVRFGAATLVAENKNSINATKVASPRAGASTLVVENESGVNATEVSSPEWEEVRLNQVLFHKARPIDKPKEGYWRLGLRSHAKGTFHTFVDDPMTVSMDTLYVVKENDLIVNITFAWEHALAIATKNDEDKLVSHRFPTYVFKSEYDADFFKYYMFQPRFKYELVNISPGGAGRNRVMSKKDFLKLKVTIPPKQEQQKIAQILTTADKEIMLLKKELEALKEQKRGLMQKLLTGEVRVKIDEGDKNG